MELPCNTVYHDPILHIVVMKVQDTPDLNMNSLKPSPYVVLMGYLWSVFDEYSGENGCVMLVKLYNEYYGCLQGQTY